MIISLPTGMLLKKWIIEMTYPRMATVLIVALWLLLSCCTVSVQRNENLVLTYVSKTDYYGTRPRLDVNKEFYTYGSEEAKPGVRSPSDAGGAVEYIENDDVLDVRPLPIVIPKHHQELAEVQEFSCRFTYVETAVVGDCTRRRDKQNMRFQYEATKGVLWFDFGCAPHPGPICRFAAVQGGLLGSGITDLR